MPGEQPSHSEEVSIMNKIVPTLFLAAGAGLVVACGGGSGMSSTTPPLAPR